MTAVLLLYAQYNVRASYYDDWVEAFRSHPGLATRELNVCDPLAPLKVRRLLRGADLVVLLHSVNADHTFYLSPLAAALRNRPCPLVSFVGNELSLPGCLVTDRRAVLAALEPDHIATQLLLEAGLHLWGDLPRRGVLAVPHALNPTAFQPGCAVKGRPIGLGTRSYRYPATLGDQDRNALLDYFTAEGPRRGFKTDISDQRLDRAQWASFLAATRCAVSSEAGTWFLSPSDEHLRALQALAGAPLSPGPDRAWARRLVHVMPWRLRQVAVGLAQRGLVSYAPLRFAEGLDEAAIAAYFAQAARPPVYGKCISSRHFDAIGTRTPQLLLEGRYNDILTPGHHYLALRADHANVEEVWETLRDAAALQRLADAALAHVLDAHTYRHRVAELLAQVL
ncbi:MAG: glycosyltransferase [Candidatus Sericytochromatia bacterium]|nr:glycosyltransferase [Candidatus Sericytochromatia bacterium]